MKSFRETILKVITNKLRKEDERCYSLKKDVACIDEQDNIMYMEGYAMDFYRSKKGADKKVYIVDIHGGGWVYGDKKLNRHFCMHLASYGYPVFNVNYGLAPKCSVKQQVQQIVHAIHFIQKQQAQYHIEHYKLCLNGDSAGAHLVSLIACICKNPHLQKDYEVDTSDICVDALLLQHGIYDLSIMRNSHKIYYKTLYEWMFPKTEAHIIGKDCMRVYLDTSWNIPMFLLSSKGDWMFSYQTKQLADQLTELDIPFQYLFWEDKKLQHVFHVSHPDYEESIETYKQMAEFLSLL